jgi:hypothetical protein
MGMEESQKPKKSKKDKKPKETAAAAAVEEPAVKQKKSKKEKKETVVEAGAGGADAEAEQVYHNAYSHKLVYMQEHTYIHMNIRTYVLTYTFNIYKISA